MLESSGLIEQEFGGAPHAGGLVERLFVVVDAMVAWKVIAQSSSFFSKTVTVR